MSVPAVEQEGGSSEPEKQANIGNQTSQGDEEIRGTATKPVDTTVDIAEVQPGVPKHEKTKREELDDALNEYVHITKI
jgi:hypothetical protein